LGVEYAQEKRRDGRFQGVERTLQVRVHRVRLLGMDRAESGARIAGSAATRTAHFRMEDGSCIWIEIFTEPAIKQMTDCVTLQPMESYS
jgi:hypothetical protein